MTLRRLSVLVLLAVLCGTVSPRATATIAARTWSVAPVDDVQLGDPLTFAGSGCLKRGVPASHMEIVIDTNYGLLGYVPVAANGTWHLVSRVTPSPGSFLMVLHASCFDDGGHMASAGAKLFFKYPQVLAVHYAGGLSLTVYPLRALAETPFHAPVAFFTYPTASGVPAPRPAQFKASVKWADGVTTAADVVTVKLGYQVVGSHTYSSPRSEQVKVTVRPPNAKSSVSKTGPIVVDPIHPAAAFDVNPTNPQKYGIALLMPHESGPWQHAITQWRWTFGDDYKAVNDAPGTHDSIQTAAENLIRTPGDSDTRNRGILLGILPKCVSALVGCFDDNDIRQVATVWREYFPRHVVPHVFVTTGHTSVTLTVVDAPPAAYPNATHTTGVEVTPTCHPWGGPLNGWFRGYTTCDTYQGVKAQFGEHRLADYVSIGASTEKDAPALKKLAAGGGVAIVITRGVYGNPAASVFLTVHLHEGVGVPFSLPYGGGVTMGWLGPPDRAHTPAPEEINSFVAGAQISAGFNLGLIGWHGIESPSTGQVGEEQFFGITNISADAGVACSWPLPDLAGKGRALQGILEKVGDPKKPPSADAVKSARSSLADVLTGIALADPGLNAILSCAGF